MDVLEALWDRTRDLERRLAAVSAFFFVRSPMPEPLTPLEEQVLRDCGVTAVLLLREWGNRRPTLLMCTSTIHRILAVFRNHGLGVALFRTPVAAPLLWDPARAASRPAAGPAPRLSKNHGLPDDVVRRICH